MSPGRWNLEPWRLELGAVEAETWSPGGWNFEPWRFEPGALEVGISTPGRRNLEPWRLAFRALEDGTGGVLKKCFLEKTLFQSDWKNTFFICMLAVRGWNMQPFHTF